MAWKYGMTNDPIIEKKLASGDYTLIAVPHYFPRDLRTFKGINFMFENIAKMGFNLQELRVLFFMLGRLEFNNLISLTQKTIAEELNMKRQNVAMAIKGLAERNIISVLKKGRNNFYKLNPEIAWRGKTKEWKNVISIHEVLENQRATDAPATPF